MHDLGEEVAKAADRTADPRLAQDDVQVSDPYATNPFSSRLLPVTLL